MNTVVAEQIRTTVEARLRELEPVLTELEELRSVLAVLDDPDSHGQLVDSLAIAGPFDRAMVSAPRVAPRRHSRRPGSKPGRDGRAPQGANKQRILAVIAANPGVAAPQIAKLTGLKRPVVASTISRLKRTGELRTHGDGVCLPNGTPASAPPNVHPLAGARATGPGSHAFNDVPGMLTNSTSEAVSCGAA
jgi:hypothetical protein